jgi:hypothetical protein
LSSILRALKKLESEPQHLERPEGVDSKYISLAGPEHRTSTVRPLLLFIGGGIACGMVILIGWWFMHDRLQPGAPATQQSSNIAQSVDTPITEPAKPLSIKPAVDSPAAVQEQTVSRPAPVSPSAIQKNQSSASLDPIESRTKPVAPVLADTPAVLTPVASPPINTVPAPAESAVKPSPQAELGTSKKTISTAAVLPETPAKPKEPEIPVLKDSDVKLQSISWSKDPSKRLAVVSNRIIREGDMVSGYQLVTINKDDLILSQKGKKWRIFFRIK